MGNFKSDSDVGLALFGSKTTLVAFCNPLLEIIAPGGMVHHDRNYHQSWMEF